MHPRPRLAVIGSGISGCSAAYFLQQHFDVILYESEPRIGGHTHTRWVDCQTLRRVPDAANAPERRPSDHCLPIDTGFIVFNDRTYPNLIRLFEQLGVSGQDTEMSFSVRCDATGIEYSGSTLDSYFAQRRNLLRPSFYRFLFDFQRFGRQAVEYLESQDETQTVGEFFRRNRYSEAFYRRYFLPMGSAIWSCPTGTFEKFPIRFICQFYHHHGLLTIRNRPQWRVVVGGSWQYLEPLTRGFADRVCTGARIEQVRRVTENLQGDSRVESSALANGGADDGANDGAEGDLRSRRWHVSGTRIDERGQVTRIEQAFDHVVFACHADQALRILAPAAGSLIHTTLSAFPYQPNQATLHTDHTVLPKRRRAWAAWNYRLPANPAGRAGDEEQATVTYNMNRLQGFGDAQTLGQTFCVTLNDDAAIDPAKVIERISYAHPIFSVGRLAAQQRHDDLIDHGGLSFCGAYWGNGFHEDGLNSALRVSQKLLGMDPWKAVCTSDGSSTVASHR